VILPENIQRFIDEQCDACTFGFDDLSAVAFNATTKRSPEPSHTGGLLSIVSGIFERLGVDFTEIRNADHDIPAGLWPDMREHGFDTDEFPAIYEQHVKPADILILAGPIWLGDPSSYTRKIIERLYAYSSDVNTAGQWSYYEKVGASVTTGNEDGGKHANAQVLYALQHIGLAIPPQADTDWNGEAGPGLSYLDEGSVTGERVDDAQHGVSLLERPALRPHAEGPWRSPGLRQLDQRLGSRDPSEPQSRAPQIANCPRIWIFGVE
jgi:multimeric flavodoxin WrbA